MEDLLPVLGFATLPMLGALAGGVLADRMDLSRRTFSLLLHATVGVVLGVVAIELMPRTMAAGPKWLVLLAFLGGGVFFLLLDRATSFVATLFGEEGAREGGGPWMMAAGVGLDLVTDGIMIGVGSSLDLSLGLLLGLSLLVVDVPEGFATVAVLKRGGVGRGKRLSIAALLALSIPLGAVLGLLLRGRPEALQIGILAFTAGILATLMVEEMVPQAHRSRAIWESTAAFLLGLAAFAAMTLVVE